MGVRGGRLIRELVHLYVYICMNKMARWVRTDLTGANLQYANLTGVNLKGAIMPDGTTETFYVVAGGQ